MLKRTVISRLFLLGCCLALAVWVAPAFTSGQSHNETEQATGALFAPSTIAVAVQSARRFGPYATLRRANEVANYARRQGYKAKVIYGGSFVYGTRRYYVDVWR